MHAGNCGNVSQDHWSNVATLDTARLKVAGGALKLNCFG